MVGGRVVEVIGQEDGTAWVGTVEPSRKDEVVWVKCDPKGNRIEVGDSFWWHGNVFWTPRADPVDLRVDVEFPKLSGSTLTRPDASST